MTWRPADSLNLAYLAVVGGLILALRDRVPGWPGLVLCFGGYALLIGGLAALERHRPHSGRLLRIRLLYPLCAIPVLYPLIERYVLLLHGRFLDSDMLALERTLLGGHPNLVVDRFTHPALSELLFACYLAYYAYFVVPPLALAARHRYRDVQRFVFAVMLTLFVCYLSYLVVPIRGPGAALRDSFAAPHVDGYVIGAVVRFVMERADPLGTCFPSAHVAVAWVVVLVLRNQFDRRTIRVLTMLSTGITAAVVYCRYHYVADTVAGILVAVACHRAALALDARGVFGADRRTPDAVPAPTLRR